MYKVKFEELLKASLKGNDLNDLVNLAAGFLQNPLVVISTSYHILAYSANLKSSDFIWLEATRRGYITLEFAATLNHWDSLALVKNEPAFLDVDQISNKKRRFFRLEYKHHHLGYLNVTEEKTNLDTVDDDAYQFVIDILSKEISSMQKNFSWQNQVQEEELLMELLDQQFINRMHFLERIRGSALENTPYFQAGCIDFSQQISYHAGRDEIQEMLRKYIPQIVFVLSGRQLIILIKKPITAINQDLSVFLKERELVLGLSDHFTDLYRFNTYYAQAKASIRYRFLLENQESVVTYDWVRLYHMYGFFDREILLTFCHPGMIALKAFDEKNHTEYVKTLQIYLLHHKSIQETAEALYVHRNTINYRIQRIKDLTGMDFLDSRQNFLLINSCEILQFLQYEYDLP